MENEPGGARSGAPRVLVIDNYDSFVYNLVQYLAQLGAEPVVHRNDAITLEEARQLSPDAVLISPGPGRPADAGVSNELIRELGPSVPLLGVCLGHQCIAEVFGGAIVRAPEIMHGKTSMIHHEDAGVMRGLPSPFEATRYHSLVVEPASFPADLQVTARTEDGVIMGLRHTDLPIEGVQFHPESVLTAGGHQLLANWLANTGWQAELPPAPAEAWRA
ncbi:MAG TPA: aminodeoxychorismate/anthranilate synthase component II [Acidimicrobiales bacterium]|nr:aminodeoxychorismate/anthranilate synthase component II [Acidimicrobiales bacterium]